MGMNTWPIGTRHSYSSELDILPDRSPAPGFTALATTDVCTTPPAAPAQSTRLHMNQLEEIDKPLLMTKTAHQKMNKPVVSILVIFYSLTARRLTSKWSTTSRISFHHDIHETTGPRGSPVNSKKMKEKSCA